MTKTERIKRIAILAIFFLISGSPALSAEIPRTPLEKTGTFTSPDSAGEYIRELEKVCPHIRVEEIGRTQERDLPLNMVHVIGPGDRKDRMNVLITAGIHGNEPAGMSACLEFLSQLTEKDNPLLKEFNFYIIYCLNPEGTGKAIEEYRKNTGFWNRSGRQNASGIDINRDFISLESTEARLCVQKFDEIKPQIVIDLHEFSSIPLVVGPEGWWRAKEFDILFGVGRHPDVYLPMRKFSWDLCKERIFPALKNEKLRPYYFCDATGNLISYYHRGGNNADYFNLRNALTFLVEIGSYDQGLSTLKIRTARHTKCLNLILTGIAGKKDRLKKLIEESKEFSRNRKFVTLKLGRAPIKAPIEGKEVESATFRTEVTINGKKYTPSRKISFKVEDYDRWSVSNLPEGYAVITFELDYLIKLMTHGIEIFEATTPIPSGEYILPPHCFYIPCSQESSAIAGIILDDTINSANPNPIRGRVLIFPVTEKVNDKFLRPLNTVTEVIETYRKFAGEFLKQK